jgi:hypothetical protein
MARVLCDHGQASPGSSKLVVGELNYRLYDVTP